ncbi:uncharacterized protein HGUI_03029 [Hanseniaspora guilliermondii]|uniref:Protein kinase domain-containing protein n=1 Tax=Hanseniaspora guilliermondii TaxID=56406 RepID=A0A1L0CPG1_9ASCO|nr:uncharacterized protein HGUI_03029 [Hanseniaspora guilliermondii]
MTDQNSNASTSSNIHRHGSVSSRISSIEEENHNNFTTSELLSLKHALQVQNNSHLNSNNLMALNNNNMNPNASTNIGRRSRSSSFYTAANQLQNNYSLNNLGTNDQKSSPGMDSQVNAVDINTNSLYGVISSPNSTKSITQASQIINELLTSSQNTNILQTQQISNTHSTSLQKPSLNQTVSNSFVETSSTSLNFPNENSKSAPNLINSQKPQLQNIITSESGLRAISESNSTHITPINKAFSDSNSSRRSSQASLLMIENQAGNTTSTNLNTPTNISSGSNLHLDRSNFFFNVDSNYKALRSPTGMGNAEGFDFIPKNTSEAASVAKSDKSATITNSNYDITAKDEGNPPTTNGTGNNSALSRHSSISNSSFQSFSKSNISTPSSARQYQNPQFFISGNNNITKQGLSQQYSINEKQYLKKIKQNQQENDYYNKRIFDSSSITTPSVDDLESTSGYTKTPSSSTNDNLSSLNTPLLSNNKSKDSYFMKNPSISLSSNQVASSPASSNKKKIERQPVLIQQDSYFNDDSFFVKESLNPKRQPSFKGNSTSHPTKPLNQTTGQRIPEREKKLKLENKIGHKGTTLKSMENNYIRELAKLKKSISDFDASDVPQSLDSLIVAEDQEYNDRLTWQMMLTRVLTGDIVTKEKSKLEDLKENALIIGTDGIDNGGSKNDENTNSEKSRRLEVYTKFKGDLWLELKAWMNGQVLQEHEKTLDILRNSVADYVFEALMDDEITDVKEFKDNDEKLKTIMEKMTYKIENYEKVTSYWANLKDMHQDKPLTKSKEFIERVQLFHSLINCVGSIDDVTKVISRHIEYVDEERTDYKIKPEYIETVVKEENIQEIFQKFYNVQSGCLFKCLSALKEHGDLVIKLGIPIDYRRITHILKYSSRLIQDIITYRIQVAKNLVNPTMMMLDQIIDDLVLYIKISAEIKVTLKKIPEIDIEDMVENLDDSIKLAINHVYDIIVLKIDGKGVGLFSSGKDTDEILEQWEVFRNLGIFLGGDYGYIVAFMFSKLYLQLTMKLHVYSVMKMETVPKFKEEKDAGEWLNKNLESFGGFSRRFSRFFTSLSNSVRNQLNFKIKKPQNKFINDMLDRGYVLVYTGGDLEDLGYYCFASEEMLIKNDGNIVKEEILNSLNNYYICNDLVPSISVNKTLLLSGLVYKTNTDDSSPNNHDYSEPQESTFWASEIHDGVSCKDMKFDFESGNVYHMVDGKDMPILAYNSIENSTDMKVISYRVVDYLKNHTNLLQQIYESKKPSSNGLNTKAPDCYKSIGVDYDADTGLKIYEAVLRGTGHVVLLKPDEPLLWEGNALYLETPIELNELYLFKKNYFESNTHFNNSNNYSEDRAEIYEENDDVFIPRSLKECNFIVFSEAAPITNDYLLEKIMSQFGQDSLTYVNKSTSINLLEKLLRKSSVVGFNFHDSLLSSFREVKDKINKKFKGLQTLNNGFLFCREMMRDFISLKENFLDSKYTNKLLISSLKNAIEWVNFICYDCKPTDMETFRWCVPAMEYAMSMTENQYILVLSSEQYEDLKRSVSGCIALLISHFDVMGGRARALEENKFLIAAQKKLLGKEISLNDYDDDTLLEVNSQIRMESIKSLEKQLRKIDKQKKKVGKVLNDSYREDKYIAKLASSLSNVTIKWRKKDFVGGGSFGDVFSAINLDTGGILAVKQIKIQRSKNMEKIFPRIKDEMTVLEVLNHPNVVQYYGVEVHRDKVNIFMEYCEGGSLASLLEHGRFEDEVITQVYSLELLEGLAYLHQSGVVHRDIKPENILLDHNGVVKYVDFGAAELVTKHGTRKLGTRSVMHNNSKSIVLMSNSKNKNNDMMGTPMYMAPENITGKKKGQRLGSDDIWSLGCVILEMTTGKRPWANLDNEWAIMYHVAAGHIPQFPTLNEMSQAGIQFLSKMLKHNPDSRSSAVELLLDPWIADIRSVAFNTSTSNSSSSDIEGSTPTGSSMKN